MLCKYIAGSFSARRPLSREFHLSARSLRSCVAINSPRMSLDHGDRSLSRDPRSYQSPVQDEALIDRVAGIAADLAPSGDARPAAQLAEIFARKMPEELLEERAPEHLARMALDSLAFLQRARPDRVDAELADPAGTGPEWAPPVTVLRTNVAERPFIVDTIREYLSSEDVRIRHLIYPLMSVVRDGDGRILEIGPPKEASSESLVYAELARVRDPETLTRIEAEARRHLRDVVRATDDFDLMLDAVEDVISEFSRRIRRVPERRDQLREVQAFLRWLRDGAFVFLGYRAYEIGGFAAGGGRAVRVARGTGLGILQDESESRYSRPVPWEQLSPELRKTAASGPLLIVSKSNSMATVHRQARMDYIGIKMLAPSGAVVGEHRFMGLFTSQAYSEPAQDIPILRRKLDAMLKIARVVEGSHDHKELITIFNSLPKEELFLASEEEIARDARTILTRYNTLGVMVSVRRDVLGRGSSIMAVLPRKRFSGRFRRDFQAFLEAEYSAEVLNYHLALGAGAQARLHFYLGGAPEDLDRIDAGQLEHTVHRLTRSWLDELLDGLSNTLPLPKARVLAEHYARAFPPEFQAATEPGDAVLDILELERLEREGKTASVSFRGAGSALRIYLKGEQLILSDFMPVLENCGLRVIEVSPFELAGAPGEPRWAVYSFEVRSSGGGRLEVGERAAVLEGAILAAREGIASNDSFNRLVLGAGLWWREADVLRAYARYAFQLGVVPSVQSLAAALDLHPEVGALLFALFEARFDPEKQGEGGAKLRGSLREQLAEARAAVSSLAHDRALGAVETLIDATVRTNYYLRGGREPNARSGGAPYLSFKVACERLKPIAESKLRYEVWVHSSRMEGVHLRGALVARGGIRHSDRPHDFRTEVLDLVATQMVKNAVIVPAGSKGGYVLKGGGRDVDLQAEAKDQYRTLIRGLLDLADNARGEEIVAAPIVRRDGDDPYLVVAADKGTARYSDAANEIANEYDYWLADAFASGGSYGYDHKKVGITARGAWVCVQRHFAERGKDIQTSPITVVGIGDMSGDVFGNGMLLSPGIRLVAAFNHRNIFIDPDPDPKTSLGERRRLFELNGSTWADYDRELLSPGWILAPRGIKSVQLTPEAKKALGISPEIERMDGESLVRAILQAPVDLLWNGGIGTYVRATAETHADAADPANDAVRITARDLRARVVGEGGNLGFTQRARVEYALRGGGINTDALDNSGGVDLSDREVNLKILLNAPMREGRMEMSARNDLLRSVAAKVAELVIEDNRSQSMAVSLDELRARRRPGRFARMMRDFSERGLLDIRAEDLPARKAFRERTEARKSLARPELAVLLAYSKLSLKAAILESGLASDPEAAGYFRNYFPKEALDAAGRKAASGHRLRREIIASQLTNDLADLMGATFVNDMASETGAAQGDVARAWLIASRIAGCEALLAEIVSKERGGHPKLAYRWVLGLSRVLRRATKWLLENRREAGMDTRALLREFADVELLRERFADFAKGESLKLYEGLVKEAGPSSEELAFVRRNMTLRFLRQFMEIVMLANGTKTDTIRAAKAYAGVSERIRTRWIKQQIREAAVENRWERQLAQSLVARVEGVRRRLTFCILDGPEESESMRTERAIAKLKRYESVLAEVEAEPRPSLAALAVAVSRLEEPRKR